MSASTQGLLFYGVVSTDSDVWQDMEEEHGESAEKQGLRFGTLADGETTGFYLAVVASVVKVNAGAAKALTPTRFVPPWQWRDKIQEFAERVGLSLQTGEPLWYVACQRPHA